MEIEKKTDEMTSKRMATIRSKNTKIELAVRRKLWHLGLRFRIHGKLPGKPDIVFTKQKIAIFLDGDFWHGKDWTSVKPKLKKFSWINKIERNIERDKTVNEELMSLGYNVLRFWESEINTDINEVIRRICGALKCESQDLILQ